MITKYFNFSFLLLIIALIALLIIKLILGGDYILPQIINLLLFIICLNSIIVFIIVFLKTKGKWYRNTKSRIVSSVYSENEQKLIHILGKNNEEAKANALLISKAPEMLEMLKDIKDYLGSDKRQEVEKLIKEATEI